MRRGRKLRVHRNERERGKSKVEENQRSGAPHLFHVRKKEQWRCSKGNRIQLGPDWGRRKKRVRLEKERETRAMEGRNHPSGR